LLSTQRVPCDRKNKQKKKVPREAAEIKSQSVVEEDDRFIEEDCSVDWAYPDEDVSSIHQVDFLGVNAIVSKTFNQSCDEIYGAETTFLPKSEGVFVSSLGILIAYRKAKHKRSTTSLHGKVVCGAFTTNIKVCL
jgi:hypothetical protein